MSATLSRALAITRRATARVVRHAGPAIGLLVVIQLGVMVTRAMVDAPPPPAPPPGPSKLMPAARGAITELAIQFHAPGSSEILGVYHQLFRALHRDTRVRVVVGTAEDRATFEAIRRIWFPDGDGPRVRYVVAGRAITSWIHDRFAVLESASAAGPTTILAPPVAHTGPSERVADWFVPWDLRRDSADAVRVKMSPFAFDGGDVIADERYAFVSTRLARRAGIRDGDERAFERVVSRTLGRTVVTIGDRDRPVPDHHVGMLILPMGDRTVLVGDAALAARTLREAGVITASDGDQPILPDVGGRPLTLDLRPERIAEIENVATALASRGFTVVRVPLLTSADGPYVFVSYTNAMVERRDGVVRVYMPTYGITSLDRLATTIVSSMGARVYPIRAERIFRMGGTLGCLVAPLARSCEGSGPRGTSECAHGLGNFRRASDRAGEWPGARRVEPIDLVGSRARSSGAIGGGTDDGVALEAARSGAGADRRVELRARIPARSRARTDARRDRDSRRSAEAARRGA